MPLPTIDGVTRAACGGACKGGARWSNTWHARRIDLADPTTPNMDALQSALQAFYLSGPMSVANSGTTVDAIDLTPLDGTSGAVHYSPAMSGAGSNPSVPAEVSMVLTLRTASRGRRARGRVYLPPFQNTSFDADGHLIAATATAFVGIAADFMADLAAGGWELGVASYGSTWRTNYLTSPPTRVETTWAPFFTVVTNCSMDIVPDVIRNRKA